MNTTANVLAAAAPADPRIGLAEARTEKAEARTEQAEARTEQANTRTEQAVTRTEQAEMRTEQAETRTEHAKTRTEQAEIRMEQAETRSEQAILASELTYRRLFEATKDGILIMEVDTGRISDVNPALSGLLGYSRDELVGKPIWELGSFKDIVANKAKFEQLQLEGCCRYENLPLETKDSHKIAVEFASNVYQAGNVKMIQCNVRDITGRKNAEIEMRRQAAFAQFNPNPVLEMSETGEINYCNAATEEMVRQLKRERAVEILPANVAVIVRECLASGKALLRQEIQVDDRTLAWSFFPVVANHSVHCYAGDITESRQLEEKFRRTQRLEAIGTLAGGIAHDFNNILSGIVGFNALARQAAAGNPELVDYLDEISRASCRAAELVQQILAFSRTSSQELAPMQLSHVVAEAVRLLRAVIPSSIKFEVYLERNLPAVQGNSTQLHQVVMNLVTNAGHAMREHSGHVSIRLEACKVDQALARKLPGLSPGPYVRLTVGDTGCGMNAAVQERIFEPFFTTKEQGEGTGLGLSVVHGIVCSHHGAIRLTSAIGRGTTFEVYLPTATTTPMKSQDQPGEIPRGHGERILFVDDEESLVRLGERTLLRLGYVAEGEIRVKEALDRLSREPFAFQLVVTDMTMPGLTGLEFATQVHALRPDLPIVLTSGNSVTLTPERLAAAGVSAVLNKPYSAQKLAELVCQVLHPAQKKSHAA